MQISKSCNNEIYEFRKYELFNNNNNISDSPDKIKPATALKNNFQC